MPITITPPVEEPVKKTEINANSKCPDCHIDVENDCLQICIDCECVKVKLCDKVSDWAGVTINSIDLSVWDAAIGGTAVFTEVNIPLPNVATPPTVATTFVIDTATGEAVVSWAGSDTKPFGVDSELYQVVQINYLDADGFECNCVAVTQFFTTADPRQPV